MTEFVNGDTYLGFFRAGKKEGLGTYYYHGTSEFYQGSWLNDLKHGHGTYHWSDGGSYLGDFENGLRHGFGVQ